MESGEHLSGENISYEGHHGKIINHEDVENVLGEVLKSEPWYINVGRKIGYKVDRMLWRFYDISRGTFIQ